MSFRNPPPRPTAYDGVVTGEVLFMQTIWDLFFDPKVSFFVDHPNLSFSKTTDGYVPKMKAQFSGSSEAWPPTNYPATMGTVKSFSPGQWIWVPDTCEAVTVGVNDPDSGNPVKSVPGLYRVLRSNAPIPSGMGFKYHIPLPQLPNDLDITDKKNYWILISTGTTCLGGT